MPPAIAMATSPALDHFYTTLFSAGFFVFEEEAPSFQEQLLQAVWNEQLLREELRTAGGEVVRIVHPGVWNVESGPDFREAVVQLNGRTLRGDVEVHLHPEAWQAHRHHHDPAYAQVVLHVVWENPAGHAQYPVGLPLLVLAGQLRHSLPELLDRLDLNAYPYARRVGPGPAAAQLAACSDAFLRDLLQSYGMARVLAKAQELGAAIAAHGLEAAVYARLLDILGYKNNRAACAALVQELPLAELAAAPDADAAIAWLLGAAGLLPDPTCTPVLPHRRARLDALWRAWWPRRHHPSPVVWNRHGLRPLNGPERRLVAAALLLQQHRGQLGQHLLQAICDAPDAARALAALQAALTLADEPAWTTFYTFSHDLPQPASLLGEARRLDLLVNLVLPLYFAWCLLHERPDWCPRGKELLRRLPRLQDNRPLKEAAHRFFSPPARARALLTNACAQQGLLKLARDAASA
jgi:hypothetical protein